MLADYMLPEEGETNEQLAERLFNEWLYARGGNHPSDVARWLAEYSSEQLAAMYQETWGTLTMEDEYVELGPDDPDVNVFVEDPVGDLLDVEVVDETPQEIIL